MTDLTKLIDLLPYYFKENDTYKDTQGKGILERFLEICGNYLEEQVVSNIESLLDNLDVDNCPEHFLSYFWEWFGCIPFAEGEFIDPDKWAQYYNGFDSKETYENKKHYWTFDDTKNPLPLTMDQKRRILKYAISLLKCRGSKTFFETMFRLYGVELIGEITDGVSELSDEIPTIVPTMDDELLLLDSANLDEQQDCMQCIPVYFNLKYTGDHKDEFVKAITNFINKYIPFNARPIIHIKDGEGQDISGGEKYYIRLTNLNTGESLLASTDSPHSGNWSWTSNHNFQLFFKVDVWSDNDPKGENSTWYYRRSADLPSKEYPSGSTKVIQEVTEDGNSITYNFYNAQSPSLSIAVELTTTSEVISGYSLNIEVWDTKNNTLLYLNPSQAFSMLNKEIRVYSKYYTDTSNTNTGKIADINVSPYLEPQLSQDGTYWILHPSKGQYRISIAQEPNVYKYINVLASIIRYKVVCLDLSGKEIEDYVIPIDQDKAVFWVQVKPEDNNIPNYANTLLKSSIQCISTREEYIVRELASGIYGIEFSTVFMGKYVFRSLLNVGDDLSDDTLYDSIVVTKSQSASISLWITPETKNLDLYGTENNEVARTVRYNVKIISSSGIDWKFSEDSSKNGQIQLRVYDIPGDTVLSPSRITWWGSDIDNPKTGLIRIDDLNAYFYVVVPYKNKSEESDPYTGFIQVSYILPSDIKASGSSNTCNLYVDYTNKEIPVLEDWVAIIPEDPSDKGWEVDWSIYYPQDSEGAKQTSAIYQKLNDDSVCKFHIETNGFNMEDRVYTIYDNKTNEQIGTGTIEDISEPILFKDPGKYVFSFEDDIKIEITVRDFIPNIKVNCNPTSALMESNYSQVSTNVSINITPDKSSYSHKVRVIKDNIDTGDILDLTNGPQLYTAISRGTYIFRSIDAEDEGLTGVELSNTDATFIVSDKNDIIGKIVCDPILSYIDEEHPIASTVVRLYDKNDNEIVDEAFQIKFPDNSTALSGTMFSTEEAGIYTFTAVNNPSISGTFTVEDRNFKPEFGSVYIDPNEIAVSKYPYENSLTIHFTAWDAQNEGDDMFSVRFTELTGDQLQVDYKTRGSSDYISIGYASPTGAKFNLFSDEGNQYHITIEGVTITYDTEIRILNKEKPEFRNGHDTCDVVLSEAYVTSIQLEDYNEVNSVYPGRSNTMYGNIILSDGSTLENNYWLMIQDQVNVYLDGVKLTRSNGSPQEGQWYGHGGPSSSMSLIVYLTKETHELYVTMDTDHGTITSNTITLTSRNNLSELVQIFMSTIADHDEWSSTGFLDRVTIDNDESKDFWLTGGYDGEDYNYEPNDEPYEYVGNSSGEDVILQCLDGDSSEVVNVGTTYTGVHKFKVIDNTKGNPVLNFRLTNYPEKTFNITLREYLKPVVKTEIEHINIQINLQNNLLSGTKYRVELSNLFFRLTHGGEVLIPYSAEDWVYPESMVLNSGEFTDIVIKGNFDDPDKYPVTPEITSWSNVKLNHISVGGFGKLTYTHLSGGDIPMGYIDIDGPRSEHLCTWNDLDLNKTQILTVPDQFDVNLEYTDWVQNTKTLNIRLTISVTN